jgi:hypothetical protein
MYNKFSFVTLLTLTLFSAVIQSCNSGNPDEIKFVEFPPTPIINPTVHSDFFKTVALDSSYEINMGLTVERMKTIAVEGAPAPSVNYVSILILNHTSESIIFSDIGFGVQVFQYNLRNSEWASVSLPYLPEKTQKVLPPNTKKYDFNVLNNWEFRDRDFVNVDTAWIRILFTGTGEVSSKKYAAFIDVTIQK